MDEGLHADDSRTARAQVGNRLAMLCIASGLRILARDGGQQHLRRPVAHRRAEDSRHLPRPTAQGRAWQLQVSAPHGAAARHDVQRRLGSPRETRRPHRLRLPSLRRCHHPTLPRPLQLHGRPPAAQCRRDTDCREPSPGPRWRMYGTGRRGESSPPAVRHPPASQVRPHLRLRGRWLRQPATDGRCQRALTPGHGLLRRCPAERPRLSEHAPLRVERGQPLLLPRQGRRRHRRPTHRL